MCFLLFNGTTLQVFVTYITGALYVHSLCFYKHQQGNRVRSTCQSWWFQWRFWFIPSVPGYLREDEEHKPDPWRNPIERNHMAASEVYCVRPRQSFWITLYIEVMNFYNVTVYNVIFKIDMGFVVYEIVYFFIGGFS